MVASKGNVPTSLFFDADFVGDAYDVSVLLGAASSRYVFALPLITSAGQGRDREEEWSLFFVS